MFVPFGLLMPSVLRVVVFPYTGVMSGMSYIATAVETSVRVIEHEDPRLDSVGQNVFQRRHRAFDPLISPL